jgi:hypothetical protein
MPFLGAGPQNGDQAVYLEQVARGAWTERWIHVGYVVAHAGWATPWRSDVFCLGMGITGILAVSIRRGWRASAVLAAFLLPALPFGEVDVHWFVLVVLAQRWSVLFPLAITVSPTALAASGWLALRWRDRRALWPVLTVLGLLVISGGAWWSGRRGVGVAAWSLDPVGQLLPAMVASVLLARRPTAVEGLALLPVLLAPSDVPAGWLGVLAVIAGRPWIRPPARWIRTAGLVVLVLWSVGTLVGTHRRVMAENARVEQLAREVGPGVRLVGPWSWRVRVALAATGRPDGLDVGERVFRVPEGSWGAAPVDGRHDTTSP